MSGAFFIGALLLLSRPHPSIFYLLPLRQRENPPLQLSSLRLFLFPTDDGFPHFSPSLPAIICTKSLLSPIRQPAPPPPPPPSARPLNNYSPAPPPPPYFAFFLSTIAFLLLSPRSLGGCICQHLINPLASTLFSLSAFVEFPPCIAPSISSFLLSSPSSSLGLSLPPSSDGRRKKGKRP